MWTLVNVFGEACAETRSSFPVRANKTRTGAIGFHCSEFPPSLATSLCIGVAR